MNIKEHDKIRMDIAFDIVERNRIETQRKVDIAKKEIKKIKLDIYELSVKTGISIETILKYLK